jgi:hypothetical protein
MQTPTAADHAGMPEPEAHWIKSSFSFSNGNCVEVARPRPARRSSTRCAAPAR